MQNNKLCWDNSVTMRPVGVLTISGRSGAIYGSQNCLQVPQHLTSMFQLMVLDSAIPAEVSCTYDMTWTFVMWMFMLEIECKAKRLLRTKISFWCFDGGQQKLLSFCKRFYVQIQTSEWFAIIKHGFDTSGLKIISAFFVMQIFRVGGSVKL